MWRGAPEVIRRPLPPCRVSMSRTGSTLRVAGNLVFLMNSGTKAEAVTAYRKALSRLLPRSRCSYSPLSRADRRRAGSQRAITALCNFFGAVVLFLSAIALYGLLSSTVAQRTAEIAVRIALGAQGRTVLWIVFSEALRLLGAGVVGRRRAVPGDAVRTKHGIRRGGVRPGGMGRNRCFAHRRSAYRWTVSGSSRRLRRSHGGFARGVTPAHHMKGRFL